MQKPIGLLALLDEESHFPQVDICVHMSECLNFTYFLGSKASDLSFLEKLSKNFKKLDFFERAKDTRSTFFTVTHYAGRVRSWKCLHVVGNEVDEIKHVGYHVQVDYDTDGFLEKNRDTLPSGVIELLQISKNTLLGTIFRGTITRTGTLALQSRRGVDKKSRMRSRAVICSLRVNVECPLRQLII